MNSGTSTRSACCSSATASPDPSAGLEAGSYAFPELQRLYDGWLAEGSESLAAAYQVGIELEERDIADLEAMIEETDQSDVRTVLEHLLAGSQHHLAAYTMAADGTLPDGNGDGMRYGPGRHQGTGTDTLRHGGRGPGRGSATQRPGPEAGVHDCWLRDNTDSTDDTSE